MDTENAPAFSLGEKSSDLFAALDGRRASIIAPNKEYKIQPVVANLHDADEALTFLENHPDAARIAAEGQAVLDDPVRQKALIRKIDRLLCPLLATMYFCSFWTRQLWDTQQ